MKRLLTIATILLFCVTNSAFADHEDTLWSGQFTPTGVTGTIQALHIAGDTLVFGGDIYALSNNTTFIGEFAMWDMKERHIDLARPFAGGFGAEVFDFENVPGYGIAIAGSYTTPSDGDTIYNVGILGPDDDWMTFSGNTSDGFNGPVRAVETWNGKVYIGGDFTQVGDLETNGFVIWDMATREFSLPSNQIDQGITFSGGIYALKVVNAGLDGYVIYAGGKFKKAGIFWTDNIARFSINNNEWEPLPGGEIDGPVYAIHYSHFSNLSGRIVIGGDFNTAGGDAVSNIALYDFNQSRWDNPQQGPNGPVYAIRNRSSTSDEMYIGGAFDSVGTLHTGPIVKMAVDIESWTDLNLPIYGSVRAMSENIHYEDGRPYFAVGGGFDFVGDSANVNNIMLVQDLSDTLQWKPIGYGLFEYGSSSVSVNDVAADTNGNVYVVGGFTHGGGVKLNRVGMWDGDQWQPLGDGVNGFGLGDIALSGDTVYVAGNFDSASGVAANRIAMWDGSSWHPLGLGLPFGSVRCMEVDLDGNLWVGGFIDSAGTIPVTGLAVWNGSEWYVPGDVAFYNSGSADPAVFDIHVDTATGNVWIAGQIDGFDAVTSYGVARWDGSMWFNAGDSRLGSPGAITIGPSGNPVVAGASNSGVYERVGVDWLVLGGGGSSRDEVLLTYGCDMYFAGDPIWDVGDEDLGDIVRWDGLEWDSLSTSVPGGNINGMAVSGNNLVVVGSFSTTSSRRNPSNGIGMWSGIRQPEDVVDLQLAEPINNDTLVYGDIAFIKWDTNTIVDLLAIEVSYDSGATWYPIHSRADAKRGALPWIVPDTNAQHCMLRLSNAEFPCVTVVPGNVFTVISPDSNLVVHRLTRKRGTYYDEPYLVKYHNFNFPNDSASVWPEEHWQSIDYSQWPFPVSPVLEKNRSANPDWGLYVDALGDSTCYKRLKTPRVVVPAQYVKWRIVRRNPWSGSCYGFTEASMLVFKGLSLNEPLILDDFDYLYEQPLNDFWRKMVNKFWIYQFGNKHQWYKWFHWKIDPDRTLDTLIKGMQPGEYPRGLSFFRKVLEEKDKDKTGMALNVPEDSTKNLKGHSVVPYMIRNVPDTPGVWYAWVYDNNRPENDSLWFRIDKNAQTWSYNAYDWTQTDTTKAMLPDLPINEYVGYASDKRVSSPKIPFTPVASSQTSHFTEIYQLSTEQVLITDGNGNRLGKIGDDYFEEIPDGAPMVITNPDWPFDNPMGYIVPEGSYELTITDFDSSQTEILWAEDSASMVYRRDGTDSSHTDIIRMSNGFTISNPDTALKTPTLISIVSDTSGDNYVELSDLSMVQNDSLRILQDGDTSLVIENYGSAKVYQTILWRATADGEAYTQSKVGIEILANSTQKLLPAWDNLDGEPMVILLDEDQDGVYEGQKVADIVTDVEGNVDPALPGTFGLSQNYPNPFNPSTTISFSLPERSDVSLVVYNILGRAVKTLVDETLPAGEHTVDWNGRSESGNRVATGVYFYRLVAGDNSASKKMLLLK